MRTNNKLLNSFLQNIISDGKSQNTADSYEFDLIALIKYISKEYHNNSITADEANNIFFQSVTFEQLNEYKNKLFSDGKSANTRSRAISSIKQFFEYLQSINVITDNPAEKLTKVKIPKRQPIFLNLNEAENLLKHVKGEYKERDNAILTIFLNCGLRLSELVGIDLDHIEDDVLKVIGKGDKQRIVYLNDACIIAINEYLKVRPNIEGEKALFISERKQRIGKTTIQELVKKYLNMSALDTDKYSVHKLRSSTATILSDSGVPVAVIQQILGHENISTTMKYVGVGKESMKEAMKNNPLNKKSKSV